MSPLPPPQAAAAAVRDPLSVLSRNGRVINGGRHDKPTKHDGAIKLSSTAGSFPSADNDDWASSGQHSREDNELASAAAAGGGGVGGGGQVDGGEQPESNGSGHAAVKIDHCIAEIDLLLSDAPTPRAAAAAAAAASAAASSAHQLPPLPDAQQHAPSSSSAPPATQPSSQRPTVLQHTPRTPRSSTTTPRSTPRVIPHSPRTIVPKPINSANPSPGAPFTPHAPDRGACSSPAHPPGGLPSATEADALASNQSGHHVGVSPSIHPDLLSHSKPHSESPSRDSKLPSILRSSLSPSPSRQSRNRQSRKSRGNPIHPVLLGGSPTQALQPQGHPLPPGGAAFTAPCNQPASAPQTPTASAAAAVCNGVESIGWSDFSRMAQGLQPSPPPLASSPGFHAGSSIYVMDTARTMRSLQEPSTRDNNPSSSGTDGISVVVSDATSSPLSSSRSSFCDISSVSSAHARVAGGAWPRAVSGGGGGGGGGGSLSAGGSESSRRPLLDSCNTTSSSSPTHSPGIIQKGCSVRGSRLSPRMHSSLGKLEEEDGGYAGGGAGLGMTLRPPPGDWDGLPVEHVVEGGPASRAGVQAGDMLLFISSMVATYLTRPQEVARAIAEAGDTFHLVVERRGKVGALTVIRPPGTERSGENGGDMGLELEALEGKPPGVSSVAASSPAAKAGVKGGDIVVGVGTLSVAGMSRGNIQRLLAGEEGTPMVLGFERPKKPCGTIWVRLIRRSGVPLTARGEPCSPRARRIHAQQSNAAVGQASLDAAAADDKKIKKSLPQPVLGHSFLAPSPPPKDPGDEDDEERECAHSGVSEESVCDATFAASVPVAVPPLDFGFLPCDSVGEHVCHQDQAQSSMVSTVDDTLTRTFTTDTLTETFTTVDCTRDDLSNVDCTRAGDKSAGNEVLSEGEAIVCDSREVEGEGGEGEGDADLSAVDASPAQDFLLRDTISSLSTMPDTLRGSSGSSECVIDIDTTPQRTLQKHHHDLQKRRLQGIPGLEVWDDDVNDLGLELTHRMLFEKRRLKQLSILKQYTHTPPRPGPSEPSRQTRETQTTCVVEEQAAVEHECTASAPVPAHAGPAHAPVRVPSHTSSAGTVVHNQCAAQGHCNARDASSRGGPSCPSSAAVISSASPPPTTIVAESNLKLPDGVSWMPKALVERVAEEYLRKHEAVKSKLEERDKKVEDDLAYVMASVGGQGVQRGRVLHALKVCHGDVAEAIMGLKRGLF